MKPKRRKPGRPKGSLKPDAMREHMSLYVPNGTGDRIDAARGELGRSDWIRRAIEAALAGGRRA